MGGVDTSNDRAIQTPIHVEIFVLDIVGCIEAALPPELKRTRRIVRVEKLICICISY